MYWKGALVITIIIFIGILICQILYELEKRLYKE